MRCTQCGAAVSGENVSKDSCRYCGAVLPHVAAAHAKAAKVRALLADNDGDGIPDVLGGALNLGTSLTPDNNGFVTSSSVQHVSIQVSGGQALPPEAASALTNMMNQLNTKGAPHGVTTFQFGHNQSPQNDTKVEKGGSSDRLGLVLAAVIVAAVVFAIVANVIAA